MTVTMNNVKQAIFKKLAENIPGITLYGEKVPDNFKRPSFFLYFVPVDTDHSNRYFYATSVLVKLDYYSESEKNSNQENWEMGDTLTRLFHKGLTVNGEHIAITETRGEVVEDEYVFTIPLTYHNGIEMAEALDDEGNTHYYEEDPALDYTEGNVKVMRELEWEEE
ncbi:phage tail terminator family protein [Salimicrobium halophilum]|uniref:Phage protein n=1 Tax=Salimicrobium halophilum TaxID=86666 RepID=A0A1G8WDG0_9BACI|nr:hypothetical protein [Salimicrobium halophilum]SDJ76263.1 hypothetical protein SAMN04490247_3131 [Salimicrobium halophilum]